MTINSCDICTDAFLNHNVKDNTIECSSKPLGECNEVKNCLTTVCIKNNDGSLTQGCRMCSRYILFIVFIRNYLYLLNDIDSIKVVGHLIVIYRLYVLRLKMTTNVS